MAAIQLLDPDNARFNTQDKIYHDGVELEKGVVITPDFLERNQDLIAESIQLFTAYPDVFLDLITPANSTLHLFPFQRLFLRACMRYTRIYITAARATSKTFLSILAKYLQCIFLPNHVGSIVAPNKSQAAKISKQKIQEIWRFWPLLKQELEPGNTDGVHANFGKDYVELYFKNGSRLTVVGALDSDRGIRTHATLIDEARDADGDAIQEIVLPQMNVSRRMANGDVNPYERVNTQVIYATSAGTKSSFAYGQLIDFFEQSIIDPKSAFCIGLDYRIPMQHSLITPAYVRNLKLSPAYNETTFAAEYLGVWLGGSDESWFQFDKLVKYRKLKNPEWHQKFIDDKNVFYLISVDVGLGVGLADEMIRTQFDESGRELQAYGFFNNDDYKKIQPKDAVQILYSLKANGPLNSKIHSNAYSRINSGMVRFLISEQDARAALLATKVGQKMALEDRVKRLMPHELTTKLFEEMSNLRLRKNGLDIVLEQINARFPKDKYSAFAYGLWRIKEIEEDNYKRVSRRSGTKRQLIFFTGGQN